MTTNKNKTPIKYWIWLQQVIGRGALLGDILDAFPEGPEQIFRASATERRISNVFTPGMLQKMDATGLEAAYRILECCAKEGADPVSPEDRDYPELLRKLPDRPAVLYMKGDNRLINDSLPFAIVGTRTAAKKSQQMAMKLSETLTKSGMLIVSGGALGIDSAAHIGALNCGGRTVCVLGSAIGSRYLQSNESLRMCIAENGVLISELAPGLELNRGDFPKRNRLISGMSCGTLVVEAAIKSGSLNTAKWAMNQGKEVFAVPGMAGAAFQGSNELLRDGAVPVERARDIWDTLLDIPMESALYQYYIKHLNPNVPMAELERQVTVDPGHDPVVLHPEMVKEAQSTHRRERNTRSYLSRRPAGDELSENARKVYECFTGTPLSIQDLEKAVNLSGSALREAVSELEIFGYLQMQRDSTYNFLT